MSDTIKKIFKELPKDKSKEILDKLTEAADAAEVIAMAKEYDIILDPQAAEELFNKLKGVTELSDEDLERVAGGKYIRA